VSPGPPRQDNFPIFLERYAHPSSDVAGRIEQEVFGHSSGVDGFTTLEEADALAIALGVGCRSTVLDLGAGRGWLASHIAEASGCRVISSDIPTGAIVESNKRFSAQGLMGRATSVGADGRALPFLRQTIDAATHSDVFC
jgi:SAM-dependent methyltransferase